MLVDAAAAERFRQHEVVPEEEHVVRRERVAVAPADLPQRDLPDSPFLLHLVRFGDVRHDRVSGRAEPEQPVVEDAGGRGRGVRTGTGNELHPDPAEFAGPVAAAHDDRLGAGPLRDRRQVDPVEHRTLLPRIPGRQPARPDQPLDLSRSRPGKPLPEFGGAPVIRLRHAPHHTVTDAVERLRQLPRRRGRFRFGGGAPFAPRPRIRHDQVCEEQRRAVKRGERPEKAEQDLPFRNRTNDLFPTHFSAAASPVSRTGPRGPIRAVFQKSRNSHRASARTTTRRRPCIRASAQARRRPA